MNYCPSCGRTAMAGITHVCPPPDGIDSYPTIYSAPVSQSDPIRLPALVREAFAHPRFLSIGSIDNVVEVRMTREVYERIKAIIGKPVGE